MDSFSNGSISLDILPGCSKGECSSTSSMKFTFGLPSVLGRPPPDVSRPKETSLGRGLGREVVSSLGTSRGEASGEVEGEEAPSSGREDDMLAVVLRRVLRRLWSARRGATLVAHGAVRALHSVIGRCGRLSLADN